MWNELTAPYKQIVTVGGKLPMKVSINKTTQKKMISNQKYYFLFFFPLHRLEGQSNLFLKRKALITLILRFQRWNFSLLNDLQNTRGKLKNIFHAISSPRMSETIFRKALIALNAVLSLTARSRDLVCLRQIPVPLS